MPELPEVQAHAERLDAAFAGAVLDRFTPISFTALKTVRPERRRRGYASALLEAALGAFPEARRVHLEVRPTNAPAIALYRRLGFVVTGRRRRYYGEEDALLMTLDLEARR